MLRFVLLCSLLLSLAAPTAAPAWNPQVFRADHATAALPDRYGVDAVLRPDRGPRRTVAPPEAGCSFWAAGTGRLVWRCVSTIDVTDLAGGDLHRQPLPFYHPDADPAYDSGVNYDIAEVGSDWVAGGGGAARSQDFTYYYNWRTGAHHTDSGDGSPTAYPDVSAPGLFTPLCAGARRLRNVSDSSDHWGTMKVAGNWTLSTNITADEADLGAPTAVLHRCGTRDGITIHDVTDSALSPSWLAYNGDAKDHIVLRHLRSGRIFHTRLSGLTGDQSLILTDRYVYSARHRLRLPKD